MLTRLARLLLVCTAFCLVVSAQQDRYTVIVEGSKSAASAVITLQQPTTGGHTVQLIAANVQCSADCQVYVDRNGTAATTTAASVTKINPSNGPTISAAKAFSDSNVGIGTKIMPTYTVTGSSTPQRIDLGGVFLEGDGNTKNVSLHIGPFTGTYSVQLVFNEVR